MSPGRAAGRTAEVRPAEGSGVRSDQTATTSTGMLPRVAFE
jgi:hypothetical protein